MSKMSPSTPERLSGYTDAVFAVIITIMVLELKPPGSAELSALLSLWPVALSYVVSYAFVAIIWINHHYLMTYITTPSLRVIWLNFGHLFFVSLVPFTTAWMAQTEFAPAPVLVYAALFVMTDGMYNLFEREILRSSASSARSSTGRPDAARSSRSCCSWWRPCWPCSPTGPGSASSAWRSRCTSRRTRPDGGIARVRSGGSGARPPACEPLGNGLNGPSELRMCAASTGILDP